MKVVFRQSFVRDLKRVRAQTLRQELQALLEQMEQSGTLYEIPNVKRLTSNGPYYRVRIGDYRLGLSVEG